MAKAAEEEGDAQLPEPLPESEQKELGERDADRHSDGGFEHADGAGVPHEAEARHRDCDGEQRNRMPQPVVGDGIGGDGRHRDLQAGGK
jgi:hypothetical protein